METTSLGQRRRRVPGVVVDAGLAVATALAVVVAIRASPEPSGPPEGLAYLMGSAIAALALVRRRWPLAVLLVSAVTLQLYYVLDFPGIFPAVPLAVALFTAWAAGHRGWSLVVTAWFVAAPVAFRTLVAKEALVPVLSDAVRDAALFAAVLLLGEAVRARAALDVERQRSERLLLNVLPASIAARLKQSQGVIADGFSDVTVLFADIVNFTPLSEGITPEGVVQLLDELFSGFDQLAQRHGLEKIKTIGDAYMVVGGLPDSRPDHAEAVAEMALAMREEVARRVGPTGRPLQVRIGIDTGPVVAGVIGRSKFSYDLWGDTVNTASRMESQGLPGCIQVTERTYQRLRNRYRFEQRGPIQVRGKTTMVTYLLLGRNPDPTGDR
jgi:class 3 adenylate cyclase